MRHAFQFSASTVAIAPQTGDTCKPGAHDALPQPALHRRSNRALKNGVFKKVWCARVISTGVSGRSEARTLFADNRRPVIGAGTDESTRKTGRALTFGRSKSRGEIGQQTHRIRSGRCKENVRVACVSFARVRAMNHSKGMATHGKRFTSATS